MHKDVIVVGAGISGIAAGYNLKKSCPNKSFSILEGRKILVVHGIFLNIQVLDLILICIRLVLDLSHGYTINQ